MNGTICISGEIDSATFTQVCAELRELELKKAKTVVVEINSGGGSTQDALALAGRLKASPCKMITRCFGACYSAATIIFAVGEERHMSHSAYWMLHSAKDSWKGTPAEVERDVKQLKKEEANWILLLSSYTDVPRALYAELSDNSTYLSAQDCLKLQIITKII